MKKFRVLSDLHIDINKKYPIKLKNDNIFTVICGDTSGYPDKTIRWIKDNIKTGVGISGNHLPYNENEYTIQQLREILANEFTIDKPFTYLDCETSCWFKEVDNILFIGTCMYTDMHISHPTWNPTGNKELNFKCSEYNMNDYKWGIKCKKKLIGDDDKSIITYITANDYFEWFKNAYNLIEKKLNENELLENPLPVVLITHHPVISNFLEHNWYIDNHIYSPKEFNWSSYSSNQIKWLLRHPSIKCYCCGHIHAIDKNYRHFNIFRDDGSKILVVNNSRGYVLRGHDATFNPNRYVNVTTWEVEEEPISKEQQKQKQKIEKEMLQNLAWFI